MSYIATSTPQGHDGGSSIKDARSIKASRHTLNEMIAKLKVGGNVDNLSLSRLRNLDYWIYKINDSKSLNTKAMAILELFPRLFTPDTTKDQTDQQTPPKPHEPTPDIIKDQNDQHVSPEPHEPILRIPQTAIDSVVTEHDSQTIRSYGLSLRWTWDKGYSKIIKEILQCYGIDNQGELRAEFLAIARLRGDMLLRTSVEQHLKARGRRAIKDHFKIHRQETPEEARAFLENLRYFFFTIEGNRVHIYRLECEPKLQDKRTMPLVRSPKKSKPSVYSAKTSRSSIRLSKKGRSLVYDLGVGSGRSRTMDSGRESETLEFGIKGNNDALDQWLEEVLLWNSCRISALKLEEKADLELLINWFHTILKWGCTQSCANYVQYLSHAIKEGSDTEQTSDPQWAIVPTPREAEQHWVENLTRRSEEAVDTLA